MQSAEQFIEAKKEKLKKMSSIGMKDIGRKGKNKYSIEGATFLICEEIKEKIYVIERLQRLEPEGKITHKVRRGKHGIVYRIGYYIVGKNGNKKGKWTWGQFCPLITGADLFRLIANAKKEGVLKE